MAQDIVQILEAVRSGDMTVEAAETLLREKPVADLGYAQVDLHRRVRQGAPEVIYGESKTAQQIAGIAMRLLEAGQQPILVTRIDDEKCEAVEALLPQGTPCDRRSDARILIVGERPATEPDAAPCLGEILVVTAGTSDIPVAEEAAVTAEFLGNKVNRAYDMGVAGIHRTLSRMDAIMNASVIIVVAGMEGALVSVVGGLASCPVIAVPTSVGYGASFEGLAALLAMLNSCASGVGVVNIDNGFGAGYLASRINQPAALRHASSECSAPDDALAEKLAHLTDALTDMRSVAVAFSGGVDSTLLLDVASSTPGVDASAILVRSPFLPAADEAEAHEFCADRGIALTVLDVDPLASEQVVQNPPDRCYHCKRLIFEAIKAAAPGRVVVDGTNVDDASDYRPGLRALQELDIRSPLKEAEFTKADIRQLSAQRGLPTADKPSAACLASRIPYGEPITEAKLARIDAAEAFLKEQGFANVRVRSHDGLARIELAPDDIARFVNAGLREATAARLAELGFSYVTLDVVGYRLGSMNEALSEAEVSAHG